MATLAETLKKVLRVDEVEWTARGNPEQVDRIPIINDIMDAMQEERGRLLVESWSKIKTYAF